MGAGVASMKKWDKVWNCMGISLVEVLALVVLVSIIFSIFSSYILASVQNSKIISNKYNAVQIADSLMNVYLKKEYDELLPLAGSTVNIELEEMLGLDSGGWDGYKATLTVEQHPESKLKDRILVLQVNVISTSNVGQKESSIKGYKRK